MGWHTIWRHFINLISLHAILKLQYIFSIEFILALLLIGKWQHEAQVERVQRPYG